MQGAQGFDNASGDQTKDDLDRWRFAREISEIIFDTPVDWSVRIGLFGGWGTGKSTVLRYLKEQLQARGSVVVDFNPSLDENFNEVLSSFGIALFNELADANLLVENKTKRFLRKASWLRSGSTPALVEAASPYFKGAKVASIGLGVFSQWLSPSGEQIAKIRESLPEQRLVVLIDDLDRTSSELLPKFLLSLRELLDLPRFTFVLAFDEGIVANTITQQNSAWGEGQNFLDKILDFRFTLPPVTKEEKRRLLERTLRENAPFIPLSSIDEVEDLLPDNPRKLKALIRGMRSMRPVVERHDKAEFSWTDLWLVQMLNQESHLLVNALYGDAFNNVLGIGYRLLTHAAKRGDIKSGSDETATLLSKAKVTGVTLEAVNRLFEAMRSRSSMNLQYVLGWSVAPPAVTWKEFNSFIDGWQIDKRSRTLESILHHHAKVRDDSNERVQQETSHALLSKIDECLNEAVGVNSIDELRHAYERANFYREALRDFFGVPGALNADRFQSFYNKVQYWRGVCRNETEGAARTAERQDLLLCATKLKDEDAVTVLQNLSPWSSESAGFPGDSKENRTSRAGLRDQVAAVVQPKVETLLVPFLQQPDSVKKMHEQGRYLAFKGLLFSNPSIWSPALRASVLSWVNTVRQNDFHYKNMDGLLRFCVNAVQYRIPDASPENVKAWLRDEDLLKGVWLAVTNRGLLPIGYLQLLGIREILAEAGAPLEAMPLNQNLLDQQSIFEQSRDEILRQL